jgi:hypothetical protein
LFQVIPGVIPWIFFCSDVVMMPFSMGADLAELNLLKYKNTCDDAETKIHKAYLNKALALHPDRGITRPAFQCAVNAFERLKHCLEEECHSTAQINKSVNYYGCNEKEEEYWYNAHYCFFQRAWEYDFGDIKEYQVYFENWHQQQTIAREKLLEEEKLASETSNNNINKENHVCMFCGREPAVTKQQAELNGVNWNEYCAHPDKLKTCWPCIEGSISVVSEKATLLKFNKKLSTMTMSNTGFEYTPFFTFLKSKVKCFHQTIHNNEITYFWFPDLEMEGWRPRGKKKQQDVPWVQKDLSSKREAVLHSTVGPDAPLHVADCITAFPHSSTASSSVLDLCTLPWLVRRCLGQCSHLASYIPRAASMVPGSSPTATTQELLVRLTIIHSAA